MSSSRWWRQLASLSVWLCGCRLAQYTIDGDTCPEGQVDCGAGCAVAEECPEDPECGEAGEIECDEECEHEECPCETNCDPEPECDDGECECQAGLTRCDGECVDLHANVAHCDACGSACGDGELCLSGECHPFTEIDDCDHCPCDDACESSDSESELQCCDSPVIGTPVCVPVDCS